jgi:hypothetical protein
MGRKREGGVILGGGGRAGVLLAAGTAAATACIGNIGGDVEPIAPAGAELAVVSGARRLSRAEYDSTLLELLKDPTRPGFALLPEDNTAPFDNDYHTQLVSQQLVEAAESIAEDAVQRALADEAIRATIVPCTPSAPDDASCLKTVIARFGRRALRRPLTAEEIADYLTLGSYATETGDFYTGVELVLRAMLQDTEFLYRVEMGEPVAAIPGVFKLTGYEMATRLSYFILGTTPDDALLDLAQAGSLDSPDGVRAAAGTLIRDPRARLRVEWFHALWLAFYVLPNPDLTPDLRKETAALINRVVFDEPTDYFELFLADETFITPKLAEHYGLPSPANPDGDWVPYGDNPRRGILSHGTVLSAQAKFADTSPTRRGKYIRNFLMCQDIGPPPPNVDADNPPKNDSPCKADKYAQHGTGGCISCHKLMDPVGFGLEQYDKNGKYREYDEGLPECPISGNGIVDGVGEFNGPGELGALLVSSGALEECTVTQLYRFAMGRKVEASDAVVVEQLATRFKDGGHAFDELLVDIVSTESFGFRKQEEAK